jgi:hypothetical protein
VKVVSYCTLSAAKAVQKATGVRPLTSPPLVAADVPPDALTADVLYFRLHGTESNTDVWFGDDGKGHKPIALRLETVERLKIDNAVVIIANCYGSDSPFVQAFYDAGARAVIAAPGENYAAGRMVMGGDAIAKWMIFWLRRGKSVAGALRRAKLFVRFAPRVPRKVRADTLEFEIVGRKFPTDTQEV